DIEHVVFWIQENRSFDHYFGAYPGAYGFSDPGGSGYTADPASPLYHRWNQSYAAADLPAGFTAPPSPLKPFHIDSTDSGFAIDQGGQCTHDIDHQWVTQHQSWNNGGLDKYLATHLGFDGYSQGFN